MGTLEDGETLNTVAFLLFIVEELEDLLFGSDINLSEVAQASGFRPLGKNELDLALLEASGPNSLTYETYSNTLLNRRVLELLLDHGAELECRDVEGNSPLYRAVLHDQQTCVEFLLERGAKVDDKFFVANDPEGETCLSTAVQLGNHAMVKTLLKYGADLSTPRGLIFHCAANSDTYMMEILVETGVDVGEVNPETEMTLLDTAFAITIDLEKAMHNYLDFLAEIHPPEIVISGTGLDGATVNARRYHAEKLRTMQYLLAKGSPPPSMMQLRHAFRLKAYHTLCIVYQHCIDAGKIVEWPDWFYGTEEEAEAEEKDRSEEESIDVLKEFIKRTRSRCVNSDYMLKYLDDETSRGSEKKMEEKSFPMLKNWCIDILRQYFSDSNNQLVEAALNKLPVPVNLKNILTLQDLKDRAQTQLDKFYDLFA